MIDQTQDGSNPTPVISTEVSAANEAEILSCGRKVAQSQQNLLISVLKL